MKNKVKILLESILLKEVNLKQSHELHKQYDSNYDGRFEKNKQEKIDSITLDVPLLIRLLEYAKEDAKSDLDLHTITENMLIIQEEGKVLTMRDYEKIINE